VGGSSVELRQSDLPRAVLAEGARIAIIAPSGVVQPARLERGLDVLRGWGYEPVVGRHVLASFGHTAGTVAQRRDDLQWAMTTPDVDAIWFARGGFGAMHLLEDLIALTRDAAATPHRPLLGFSDATAFLAALYREQRLAGDGAAEASRGLLGIHAPVITALGDLVTEEARELTRALLRDGRCLRAPVEHVAGPRVSVTGPLVGGNLAMLAALAGTPHALRSHDAIMVLEDVGEPVYRLDRMVTQLQLSGGLLGVRAFALGSFSARPGERDEHAHTFMEQRLGEFGVPVVIGLPVGHDPANEPWVYGRTAQIDLGPVPAGSEQVPLPPHAEDVRGD
jgi:muramoyltetrapeptide carboxypeptidase